MTSYFDPKSWSPMRAAELGKGWVDQWVSVTAAWVDPVANLGAGTVTALMPDVLMSALTDGILRRFGGQSLDVMVQGAPVQAVLGSLRVRRRGSFFQAKVELADVVWDGHTFSELTLIANGVRLVPGVPTRLRAEQIDLTGQTSIYTIVDWLNGRDLDWLLEVEESGLIGARHRRRNLTAVVDASVVDDLVKIKVINARWQGLPIPRSILPGRAIPLERLPKDARIVRADRDGHTVSFTLDVPTIKGSLDLAQIRDAIVAGTGLIVF
ncbi:hypothetical protein [Antrihabitans cavernicola]|uniref:DUF2993 domain-containing protein n=1 Tax=Antrihabitans cavernicola TaxID=2495913 RepID=A0A5A7SJN7_9NOCA|nr:hypothetical protein [Spelaeibacter cavernicola]KAA0024977.1 hypothetical protein FOY51_03430 [Spelaeibacter cavernicola]